MNNPQIGRIESFDAWAIDTYSKEGHGFIGRYWWFGKKAPTIPIHLEGCQLALFKTRTLARKYLPDVTGAFPRAQVAHVHVTVQCA